MIWNPAIFTITTQQIESLQLKQASARISGRGASVNTNIESRQYFPDAMIYPT
jgi:hypothetical protein